MMIMARRKQQDMGRLSFASMLLWVKEGIRAEGEGGTLGTN